MCTGAFKDACDHRVLGFTDIDQPSAVQQISATGFAQIIPQLIGKVQQRNVVAVLEIRPANDSGLSMRAASVVRRLKSIDSKYAHPCSGEFIKCCATDSARSDHDGIVHGLQVQMCSGDPVSLNAWFGHGLLTSNQRDADHS